MNRSVGLDWSEIRRPSHYSRSVDSLNILSYPYFSEIDYHTRFRHCRSEEQTLSMPEKFKFWKADSSAIAVHESLVNANCSRARYVHR